MKVFALRAQEAAMLAAFTTFIAARILFAYHEVSSIYIHGRGYSQSPRMPD